MAIYKEADGLRYHLEQRENSGKRGEFPKTNTKKYTEVFRNIEEYLNKHVHPEVVIGAALKGDGLLNDHGIDHVAMVIDRANLLLETKIKKMKGFEIFLLLLSIHFHDVGNIYGREKHEEQINNIIVDLGSSLPLDSPTKRIIANIAMSHGGKINDNKDTISYLDEYDHLLGIEIRPALIASILRYADEIADDHTRAARYLYKERGVPPQNQVFHDYSNCLQPAAVVGNTLILKFDIPLQQAICESSKKDEKAKCGWCNVFLYDEILDRLKKCLCELEYCRKYAQGFITISSIQADITVYKPKTPSNLLYKDSIRLRLSGYPTILDTGIDKMWNSAPKAVNGIAMKELLENSEKRLSL